MGEVRLFSSCGGRSTAQASGLWVLSKDRSLKIRVLDSMAQAITFSIENGGKA